MSFRKANVFFFFTTTLRLTSVAHVAMPFVPYRPVIPSETLDCNHYIFAPLSQMGSSPYVSPQTALPLYVLHWSVFCGWVEGLASIPSFSLPFLEPGCPGSSLSNLPPRLSDFRFALDPGLEAFVLLEQRASQQRTLHLNFSATSDPSRRPRFLSPPP